MKISNSNRIKAETNKQQEPTDNKSSEIKEIYRFGHTVTLRIIFYIYSSHSQP